MILFWIVLLNLSLQARIDPIMIKQLYDKNIKILLEKHIVTLASTSTIMDQLNQEMRIHYQRGLDFHRRYKNIKLFGLKFYKAA